MSSKNNCPQCGETATGNFCANCGAALGGRFCNQCGTKAQAGDRFCKECGAGLGAAPGAPPQTAAAPSAKAGGASGSGGRGGAGEVGWWVAGGMLVVVIFFMVMPLVTGDDDASGGVNAPFAGGGAAGGVPSAATTDLSSMTPREAADRLYERVMRSAAANDSNQVVMFLPMSIQAYDQARPLDPDGLFHLSRLQRMALQDEAALQTAQAGLEDNPEHLLNLYAAGDAALALGQPEAAQVYLSRLLEVWDAQLATDNPDYDLHAQMLPDIRAFAEQNAAGG